MIVHPIGMMRATAASGFSFSDDFGSTYHTLGDALTVSGLYTNISGFRPIKSKDSGGTRVAAQDLGTTQDELITYTDETVPDARKVSLTVRQFRDGDAGHVFRMYAAYADADNYVLVQRDTGGYVKIVHRSSATDNINVDILGAMPTVGTVSVELNGTSMAVKVAGSHIGASPYTVPSVTGYGPPGLFQKMTGTTTISTEFSLFEIEEL